MAIYRFSFDNKYAGHAAVVTDMSGNAVTGSPITLDTDGDGTLTLTTGIYRAQVDNAQGAFGDGYSVVDGELDLGASLDAVAGGGGGALLDNSTYTLEYNAGTAVAPDNTGLLIPFDTLSEGVTDLGSGHFSIPAGIYIATYDIEPSQPDEDRWGHVTLDSTGMGRLQVNPIALSSVSGPNGYTIGDQKVIGGGTISLTFFAKSAAGSGGALTVEYALLELRKLEVG